MLSVGAICFEDRFCTSKNGGIRGGGLGFSTGCLVHGTSLVEILWLALAGPFLSFLSQMGIEKAPLPL